LAARGWLVVRVWEHDDPADAAGRIARKVKVRLKSQARREVAFG
jgi:hypothetical protein